MPIDEQIKLLAREFKTFGTKLDSIDTRLTSVETKLTAVETKLTTVETKLTNVDGKVDKMQILLEGTNAVAKLGLEGIQGLRESTDEKFAAAAQHNAEQTELLKGLFVHVRKRVERVEPPKRRRG